GPVIEAGHLHPAPRRAEEVRDEPRRGSLPRDPGDGEVQAETLAIGKFPLADHGDAALRPLARKRRSLAAAGAHDDELRVLPAATGGGRVHEPHRGAAPAEPFRGGLPAGIVAEDNDSLTARWTHARCFTGA